MLMQEPTQEMMKEWKKVYSQYKDKIQPNKKTGVEIIKYLESHYSITEIQNNEIDDCVIYNINNNEFLINKLKGQNPIIRCFEINNTGNGKDLYLKQENVFNGIKIVVGIELKTSYIFVEGSGYLYDELIAYTGLDKYDIKNYFIVAQYIECKERFKV